MKIIYKNLKVSGDKDAGAIYVQVRDTEQDYTKEIAPNVIIDYDANDQIIGVEILGVEVSDNISIGVE